MKNTFTPVRWHSFLISAILSLLFIRSVSAQVVLTKDMSDYSQDFNTLPVSGPATWESGTFYMPGWKLFRTIPATTTLLTGTGSSNTGGLYSFGLDGSTDRALGAISSGGATAGEFAWGLLIQNNTGATMKTLHVSFTGEQWRSASKTAGRQATTFWYSLSDESPDFDLSPLSDNNWTNVPDLDFYSPIYLGTAGALDGNLPGNKSYLSATISVNIPDGYYIMLRWKDLNDLDDDHGLAIDDFMLSWSADEYTGPIVLPVEFIFFKPSQVARGVKLDWATASERNSSHFNIERSTNGLTFEMIGSVGASGNSSNKNNYSYLDEEPLIGTTYYRLKQVDLDDTYEYSNLVSVNRSGPGTYSVYPTVSDGDVQLKLPYASSATPVLVYDKMGKLVLSEMVPAQLVHYRLDIKSLKSGNYFVILPDTKGERQVFRIIKK